MTQSKVLILPTCPVGEGGAHFGIAWHDLGMSYEIANVAKEKKPDLPDFKEISAW